MRPLFPPAYPSTRKTPWRTLISLLAVSTLLLTVMVPAFASTNHVNHCPEGWTLLAKYDVQGGEFVAEGDDIITFSNITTKEDEPDEVLSADWDSGEVGIDLVIVNGGNDTKSYDNLDGATSGTVSTDGMSAGGTENQPGISNVLFCGAPPTVDLEFDKTWDGDTAPDAASSSLNVHDGETLIGTVDDGGSLDLTDHLGETLTVTEVVTGFEDSDCTYERTAWTLDGEAFDGTIEVEGEPEADITYNVAATNTVDCPSPSNGDPETGDLVISKVVTGDLAPEDPEEYEFGIACDDDFTDDFTLSDGGDPYTLEDIEAGTTCTVDEATGEDFTTTVSIDGGNTTDVPEDGAEVQIAEDGEHTMVFTNDYGDEDPTTTEETPTVLDEVAELEDEPEEIETEVAAEVLEKEEAAAAQDEVEVLGETIQRPSGVPAGSGGLAATGMPVLLLALMALGAMIMGTGTLAAVRKRR